MASSTRSAKRAKHSHSNVQLSRSDLNNAGYEGRDVLSNHRNKIHDFLHKNAPSFNVLEITPNPSSQVKTPLYEKFLESWCDTDMNIKLVFHGTKSKNIKNILKNGLDPRRRQIQLHGPGEYFAFNGEYSYKYCKKNEFKNDDLQILVFAVLTEPSGVTTINNSMIVIHKSEHQLPLFTIKFNLKSYEQFVGRLVLLKNMSLTIGLNTINKYWQYKLNSSGANNQEASSSASSSASGAFGFGAPPIIFGGVSYAGGAASSSVGGASSSSAGGSANSSAGGAANSSVGGTASSSAGGAVGFGSPPILFGGDPLLFGPPPRFSFNLSSNGSVPNHAVGNQPIRFSFNPKPSNSSKVIDLVHL